VALTLSAQGRSLLQRFRETLREEYREGCRNSQQIPELLERWKTALRKLPDSEEAQHLRAVGRALEGEVYLKLNREARRHLLTEVGLQIGRLLGDSPGATELRKVEAPSKLSPNINLTTEVTYVKGVGPKMAQLLERINVVTVGDLIGLLPRRWEDRTRIVTAATAEDGEVAVVQGKLGQLGAREPRRGLSIVSCPLYTKDGVVDLIWFNQKWIMSSLKTGLEVSAFGKIEFKYQRPQISSPELEAADEPFPLAGRWVPVYPATARMSQRWLRSLMMQIVPNLAPHLPDPIPGWVRQQRGFLDRAAAVLEYHFPTHPVGLSEARRRLAYEEFFLLQVELAVQRRTRELEPRQTRYDPAMMRPGDFFGLLPFQPTGAQSRVAQEIVGDLQSKVPMNRLLQGDVGSGKTAVAAFAAWAAVKQGYQAAIMAPTEILAEQHYQKLGPLLAPAGIRLGFLSGSMKKKAKDEVKAAIAAQEIDLAVGTHALIQADVEFAKLSLVVVDEQHKFGVLQRTVLRQKGYMNNPDLLVMTATPIPRTLALTVHGELEVSKLDELPPGRLPIRSESVPFSKRKKIYEEIKAELREGRQVYIVCPMIEEAEEGVDKKTADLSSVKAEHKVLAEQVFQEFSVALLHGRMKATEKEAVMDAFRRGEYQILVSTTVIEVGVDVPNATIMLVQDADRFGLSQLHQLRGRVGRGGHSSRCIFMSDAKGADSQRRLKAIAELSDGFDVAEEDLQIRGPGDYFGLRQSGVPDFQVADLLQDLQLLDWAQKDARLAVERDPDLDHEPALRRQLHLRAERTAELVH
jgi:ATP-dependent DNA helicase RecG